MRHLLKTSDLAADDVAYLLKRAAKFKAKPHSRSTLLAGDTVCMYFSKPSTRTRISFETAIVRLGGTPVFLGPNDLQLGRGETIEDTAQVISRYARAFVTRTFKDEDVARFAAAATIPVINALTDGHHPCQSLAYLLTLTEHKGALDGLKITYLGDGNNVAVSLMQAAALNHCHFGPQSICIADSASRCGLAAKASSTAGGVSGVGDGGAAGAMTAVAWVVHWPSRRVATVAAKPPSSGASWTWSVT
jgi:ornithine carbamoyltransferase